MFCRQGLHLIECFPQVGEEVMYKTMSDSLCSLSHSENGDNMFNVISGT